MRGDGEAVGAVIVDELFKVGEQVHRLTRQFAGSIRSNAR
jgi:hypothetical protein